jgi:hypothetical protein
MELHSGGFKIRGMPRTTLFIQELHVQTNVSNTQDHRGLSSGLLKIKRKKNLIFIKVHLWKPSENNADKFQLVYITFEKHTL